MRRHRVCYRRACHYDAFVPAQLAALPVQLSATLAGLVSDAELTIRRLNETGGRADFAEAAAVVLTGPGHEGQTYELAGDEAYSLRDLAAEVSRQTGRTIPYRNLPEAEYAAALVGAGVPEELARMIGGWDTAVAQDALFDEGRQLSKLIGRPTTPLSIAVRDALIAREQAA